MPETTKSSNKEGLLEKFVPALLILTVALAFAVGILWNKVSSLEGGKVAVKTGGTAGTGNAPDVNGKLSAEEAKKLAPVSDSDHIRGSKSDAKVFLIEYSDLQCPYCASFHPTAKQALSEYGDKIAWVYRHFPLESIHPRARPAANAAECVANLGGEDAFWKFVDAVFADQEKTLPDAGLKSAAIAVGVKAEAFSGCYSAKKFESVVDSDLKSGETAGVTGTPGNFIMNKKGEVWVIPGAVPFEILKATIDEALK